MKSVMIDLETMGRSSRAAIVQIGACLFDDQTGEISRRLSVNVDLQSSIAAGLEVDGPTVEFWMGQADKTWRESKVELRMALRMLFNFFMMADGAPVWSHATFDMPIIDSAYRAAGDLPTPFRFQDCRDLRTLIALADYERPEHKGVRHDALSDCEYQVAYLVEALKKLRAK